MRYLLAASGHEVLEATNGADALKLARQNRPDLIVSDMQMPGLDGFGLIAALRADPVLRGVPVIAVTASAMMGDRETIIAAGFHDYLSKPIEPETFVARIERHLPPAGRSVP